MRLPVLRLLDAGAVVLTLTGVVGQLGLHLAREHAREGFAEHAAALVDTRAGGHRGQQQRWGSLDTLRGQGHVLLLGRIVVELRRNFENV